MRRLLVVAMIGCSSTTTTVTPDARVTTADAPLAVVDAPLPADARPPDASLPPDARPPVDAPENPPDEDAPVFLPADAGIDAGPPADARATDAGSCLPACYV